jgi:uncharacterized membrane protein
MEYKKMQFFHYVYIYHLTDFFLDRNFPTAENIEKKKAIQAERIARGEVIEEKYFG